MAYPHTVFSARTAVWDRGCPHPRSGWSGDLGPGAGSRATSPPREPALLRSAFTVLELLIVMGVLSILLSILLPVFHNARKATLKARAKIEATALAQAVIQYRNIYGYWPGMVRASGENLTPVTFSHTDLNWPLVSRLSNEWFTVSVTTASASPQEANYISGNALYRSLLPFDTEHTLSDKHRNPLNPERVRFVDLAIEETPAQAAYPDPWGNQYIVVMGLNPSTLFTHDFRDQNARLIQRVSVSNLTAFALSLGAERTNLIFSAGVQ